MTRYLTLSLLLIAFALPTSRAADPVAPKEPTCAKKVSKQAMSGGVLNTVMVDNASCLAQWEAYPAAAARYAVAQAAAFRELVPGTDGDSALGPMRWIPAGTFTMGSPISEEGRNEDEIEHNVTLTKGYWLMEHEVTQGQWQAVMGSNPSKFTACGPTCPVEQVSWDDAVAFAKKASARDRVTYGLPTEAQWEFAARGGQATGQQTLYAGSNEATSVGWIDANSGSTTHAVCGKARNGYGLCDMTGNVWEWTSDGYGSYGGSATDPKGDAAGSSRVYRGGSWGISAQLARVANHGRGAPSARSGYLGFRLSRTLP